MTIRVSSLLLSLVLSTSPPAAAQWYVSPTGSDTSAGSRDLPFLTISKAHSMMAAGDTIYLEGGTYPIGVTTTLSKSGTVNARNVLVSLPGTRALLDFSQMAFSSSNRGMRISGSYWYLYGIDVKGAGDNGLQMSGSNNVIEFCTFFENRDSGVQLDNGASNNTFINCDSYNNADPGFENADGFAPKLTVGSGNRFVGCRAWQNADDGWDGYLRGVNDVTTTLENCWSFKNGFLMDGTPSIPNGDGNGFKMGGSDDKTLRHNMVLIRCLAFDNRVKGFDQNNNRGSMTLLNSTSWRNGTNYSLPGPVDSGKAITITNGISFGPVGTITSAAVVTTSSWVGGFTVTADDFASLDTAGMRRSRSADGSLPDVAFLHLAYGSDLIDAGTPAGVPFTGPTIDLGAFEFDPATFVASITEKPFQFAVVQNFPNPFNPDTRMEYTVPGAGATEIHIFDLTGRRVYSETPFHSSGGKYTMNWRAANPGGAMLPSGTYLGVIRHGNQVQTIRMLLLK